MSVAAQARERRVIRRLEARGMRGLGQALVQLRGTQIDGRWELGCLYAVGAEGSLADWSDRQSATTSGASAAALRRRAETKCRSRWPYDRSTDVRKACFVSLGKLSLPARDLRRIRAF